MKLQKVVKPEIHLVELNRDAQSDFLKVYDGNDIDTHSTKISRF